MELGVDLLAASRTGHFTIGNRNHSTQHMYALGREYFRSGLPVILQNWAIPSGNMGGGPFPRDSERWMKGALEVERLSLRELCERNLEGGGLFYWGPWGMCKGRLWRRAFLSMGAPLGNLEGCSYTGYVER